MGINKNKIAEWDWVVESNSAAASTTYYFRMVLGDGTALAGYTNYPQATTAAVDLPPAAPTGLVATAGAGSVSLNWDDNTEPDLAGYNVYRSTTSSGPYSKINGTLVASSAYNDTGVTNGTTYYYVVRAEDSGTNESSNSNEDSATPNDPPPAAPTGLVATAGDGSVSLNWDDNTEPDLAGYNVYRSTTSSGPYSKINGTLVASSTYNDTGVTNGTTYYYVVRAEDNGTNESSNSNEDNATPNDPPPAAPTGLVATAGDGTVSLNWDDNTEPDLAGYNVYRSTTSSGPYSKINGPLVTSSTYNDTSVTNGTTYYYVVRAEDNGANDSSNSSEVSSTPNATILTQNDYRWYQNMDAVPPTTPLAAENTATTGVGSTEVLRVRMNVTNGPINLSAGQTFKLQYSTSTAGPWTDVGPGSSTEIWRGFDNSTPVDGETLSTTELASSSTPQKQTYEEANVATSVGINKNKNAEWDWVIQSNCSSPSTTYYFRMVLGSGAALAGYTNYPQLTTTATAGVTITPNNSTSGAPESVVSYTHTVTNTGPCSDTIDITTSSTQGWGVSLYETDGVTPLSDTDSDTTPDTGTLSSGASVDIVVKVTVGWTATSDTTTVTGTSSSNPSVQDSGTDTTTAPPTINISISDTSAEFGTNLVPTAVSSNSSDTVAAYAGSVGNQGTYYVWLSQSSTGVSVTVKSNLSWSATTAASENSGTSPSMTVASGVWRYSEGALPTSYSDCSGATALTTTTDIWKSSVPPGVSPHVHYYCLRVDWIDDPGTFISTITYEVTQL